MWVYLSRVFQADIVAFRITIASYMHCFMLHVMFWVMPSDTSVVFRVTEDATPYLTFV
jgi:hypothetical protein